MFLFGGLRKGLCQYPLRSRGGPCSNINPPSPYSVIRPQIAVVHPSMYSTVRRPV